MRILVLTQWFPPEPAVLLRELTQTLAELGHEVTVLTGLPNYPEGRLYPGYRLRVCQREQDGDVSIVRAPLFPDHSRSGVKRALNYLSFAGSSTLIGAWAVRQPDVVFVYHPPLTVALPALVLSTLWRVPFVYQVQDLWPETLRATGMVSSSRVLSAVGRFARFVYRRAAAILVISPGFRKNLIDKGVPPSKVSFIPNWVDCEIYRPEEVDAEAAVRLGLADRFNVMFAGNIGEAQGLETVLEAARLLRDLPEVQFVIVGDGTARIGLEEAARRGGLDNVRFLGRRPSHEMSKLYATAEVLLVHLKDDPLFRITIPHKTLTYLATGKPILAAVPGDVADLVVGEGAGIACPPSDARAMAEVVRRFVAMGPGARRLIGERGLDAARTKYARKLVIARIESVLAAVVVPGPRGG